MTRTTNWKRNMDTQQTDVEPIDGKTSLCLDHSDGTDDSDLDEYDSRDDSEGSLAEFIVVDETNELSDYSDSETLCSESSDVASTDEPVTLCSESSDVASTDGTVDPPPGEKQMVLRQGRKRKGVHQPRYYIEDTTDSSDGDYEGFDSA